MGKLKIGDRAPAFERLDQNGNTVKLSDFAGRKLLVYFYPRADTPGCTAQSCDVRDGMPALASLGIDAIGVSPDSPAKQLKFDHKYHLGFPLLADEDNAMAEAYGVWTEKKMFGVTRMGMVRSSFLIGEDGVLLGVWYNVKPLDTVPKARRAIEGP